jgi:hypothetical protein
LALAGLERDIASPLQYPGAAMKTVKGNAMFRSVPLPLPSAGSLTPSKEEDWRKASLSELLVLDTGRNGKK